MKVSREQAAANREYVVDVASTLFRKHGFDGIGVADIMKAAGLTHGGFYGHFDSKDDLAAAACSRALRRSWDVWIDRSSEVVLPRFCGTTLTQVIGMIARTVASSRHSDRTSFDSRDQCGTPLRKVFGARSRHFSI